MRVWGCRSEVRSTPGPSRTVRVPGSPVGRRLSLPEPGRLSPNLSGDWRLPLHLSAPVLGTLKGDDVGGLDGERPGLDGTSQFLRPLETHVGGPGGPHSPVPVGDEVPSDGRSFTSSVENCTKYRDPSKVFEVVGVSSAPPRRQRPSLTGSTVGSDPRDVPVSLSPLGVPPTLGPLGEGDSESGKEIFYPV